VTVGKKRPSTPNANKTALLSEAIDKLLSATGLGTEAFRRHLLHVPARAFLTQRGGLYWPHRASVFHKGQRWPYFICPEGGDKMESISVSAHDSATCSACPTFTHRRRARQPRARRLVRHGHQVGKGKPQHFCAWSKEQLGWLEPAVIDPSVKQNSCCVVQHGRKSVSRCWCARRQRVFPSGNRTQKGLTRAAPRGIADLARGQWQTGAGGIARIAGPIGPRIFLSSVPYPSRSNDAFTPYTTPSSRSPTGGGLPVHISNIRRLPDGTITFYIGYSIIEPAARHLSACRSSFVWNHAIQNCRKKLRAGLRSSRLDDPKSLAIASKVDMRSRQLFGVS